MKNQFSNMFSLHAAGPLILSVSTFAFLYAFLLREAVNQNFSYLFNFWLLIVFGAVLLTNLQKPKLPSYVLFYLLFVLYTLGSDIFIAHRSINISYLYSNKLLYTFLLFFFIENGKYEKALMDKYVKINYNILYVVLALILIQQTVAPTLFVSDDYVRKYYFEGLSEARLPSIYSYMSGSIHLGFTVIPVIAVFLASALKDNNLKQVYVLLFIGAVYSFLTKYRWIMLNYMVLFVMFAVYKEFWTRCKGKLISGLFLGLLLLIAAVLIAQIPLMEIVNERILEKSRGGMTQGSAGTRLIAVEVFLKLFPKNPIFGKGMLHGFSDGQQHDIELLRAIGGRSSQIHVGYLSLFYYYGIAGGSLFLMFLVSLGKKMYANAKTHQNWGVFTGCLGFVLANLTLVTFNLAYAGLLFLLIYNRYLMQEYEESDGA